MVWWHVSPLQPVWMLREEADEMMRIIEAYDGIPFVWRVAAGYIFVLLPRHRVLC